MPANQGTQLGLDLGSLASLPIGQLKIKWRALMGDPPRGARRDFLIRGIAYRLQEQAFGGLTAATRRRLRKLSDQFDRDPKHGLTTQPTLMPGTRLLREWRGEIHEAEVLERGFLYRGRMFSSLSEVARTITGTRWSGPLFFGLVKSIERKAAKAFGRAKADGLALISAEHIPR